MRIVGDPWKPRRSASSGVDTSSIVMAVGSRPTRRSASANRVRASPALGQPSK